MEDGATNSVTRICGRATRLPWSCALQLRSAERRSSHHRESTTASRLSPPPPKRRCLTSLADAALDSERKTSNPGGRSPPVSLKRYRPLAAATGLPRGARPAEQEGLPKTSRRTGRFLPDLACSLACHCEAAYFRLVGRVDQESCDAQGTSGDAASAHPKGADTGEVSTPPRTGRACTSSSRIPVRMSLCSGVDTTH